MSRRTGRRVVTVCGAAAVFIGVGVPVFSGPASAATVSASPSTAANSGPVAVTLTGGAGMVTATSVTLTKHNDPSVTVASSSLGQTNPPNVTKRVAQFQLTDQLPGVYDITVHETGGNETCVSAPPTTACFTITGLPPTVTLTPPSAIVVGSTASGTLTLSNPARGDVYSQTRLEMDLSGDAGLKAADLTFTATLNGAPVPTELEDSGGDVLAFVGAASGFSLGQNQTGTFSLVFGAKPNAPIGTLSITTRYGHVDSNGELTDTLAEDDNKPSAISNVAPGATYHPVAPVRVLDTRTGLGGHTGALGPNGSAVLVVGGKNGVPTTATAAVLNITATGGQGSGYLVAFPTGAGRPVASNVDYVRGDSVANLAVVPLSSSGHALTISNGGASTVHVIADLVGYYDPTSGGLSYTPMAPARVLDTRSTGVALAAGGSRVLTVAGNGGVPASGVSAVTVNVTVTQDQRAGYLVLYQTGATQPSISNLDFNAQQTIANLDVVQLNSGGQLTIVNHSQGTAHVLVDVQGYFGSSSSSSLHALSITRLVDTRSTGAPLPGNSTMTVTLGGKSGVPGSGLTMMAVNVTVTSPTRPGYLAVYAGGASQPATSNANFVKGQTIADLAYVKVTDNGSIKIFNGSSAPVHIIIDVEGFGTSP